MTSRAPATTAFIHLVGHLQPGYVGLLQPAVMPFSALWRRVLFGGAPATGKTTKRLLEVKRGEWFAAVFTGYESASPHVRVALTREEPVELFPQTSLSLSHAFVVERSLCRKQMSSAIYLVNRTNVNDGDLCRVPVSVREHSIFRLPSCRN